MSPHLLGHLANVVFAGAYLVRGVFWLRVLSVAGCTTALGFNYFAPATPLWTAIFWNVVFIAVNAVAVARAVRRRRAARRLESSPCATLCTLAWLRVHLDSMQNG